MTGNCVELIEFEMRDCQTHLRSASGGPACKGRKEVIFRTKTEKASGGKKRPFVEKKTKADGQRIRRCKCGMG